MCVSISSHSSSDEDAFTTPSRSSARTSLHNTTNQSIQDRDNLSSIALSLKETNQLLTQMYQRMEKMGKKIKDVETKLDSRTNPSPGSTPTRKKVVPTEVRVSWVEGMVYDRTIGLISSTHSKFYFPKLVSR